jgi:putative hemolysin
MDEDPLIYQYIILAALLLCSAFFSGSETAIFSLNRLERNSLLTTPRKGLRKKLSSLLAGQEKLLITILTGNTIVNIFASGLGENIGAKLFGGEAEFISIAAMTIILLIIGELTPKRIAVEHPKGFTRLAIYPLTFFHTLFAPLRIILSGITKRVLALYRGSQKDENEHKHTLVLSTAELGLNQHILKHSEYRLFKSYLLFKEKQAKSIMTPRNQLSTIPGHTSIKETLGLLKKQNLEHSFLLLHEEDIDHLSGWISLPDLLHYKFSSDDRARPVSALARDFLVVPESKLLIELIVEMREESREVVLLVDEYGGTAGILWIKNIIEDVLKAFYTPYNKSFSDIQDHSIIIPGAMSIEEFAEFFGEKVDTEAETAAGLFIDLYGKIPHPEARVEWGNFDLMVASIEAHTITEIMVTEKEPDGDL